MVNIQSKKFESILILLIGIVLVIIVNQLVNRHFFRIDLTEEKRYTISDATIDLLENLPDVVYVQVYLEGDFPAPFKRLQQAIRETLDEFKRYAGSNIQFEFIDPALARTQKARQEYYESLAMKGIQPTNLYDSKGGKQVQNLIFPGAVITYGTRETGVMLLKGNKASSPQEQLNQSIEGIEYELSSAIKRISRPGSRRIALLQGHGELDTLETAGLSSRLLEDHKVYYVNLKERKDLLGFDAVIMAKPDVAFSEIDKYKIDQYLMHGGRLIFLMDMLKVNMDSAGGQGTYAIPLELNLDDMFFKYGFRLNREYVIDMQSGQYPVVVGNMGENPQVMLLQWPFFPMINSFGQHLIVRNLDAVYCKFAGTIDTVKLAGVTRTPLMFTSQYSRVLSAPVQVSVNELRKEMKPEFFNSGPQTIGWLMEGKFTSLYKNRFLPPGINENRFRENGDKAKIIVIADGDIARNDINPKTGQPVELGFDQFTQTSFANADLLNNAVLYLVEENGLINTRGKEIRIRPLDTVRIAGQKLKWQLINLLLPIVLIIVFGIVKAMLRKKKYAGKKP
jgi:gliding-associated putative ABC transporter substrate-binding component GldG